jgi:hypothetical protein
VKNFDHALKNHDEKFEKFLQKYSTVNKTISGNLRKALIKAGKNSNLPEKLVITSSLGKESKEIIKKVMNQVTEITSQYAANLAITQ